MTIRYKIKENDVILKDKEWKVYFIKCGDSNKSPVKIGYTSDLNQRMKSIQVGCPYKISLLFALPCESKCHAKLLEKFLHKQLWHRSHLCGEWFMLPNQSIPKLIDKFNGAYKGEYNFEDTYLVKGDVYGLNIDAVKRENSILRKEIKQKDEIISKLIDELEAIKYLDSKLLCGLIN